MPPKPNALMPARRGVPAAVDPRARLGVDVERRALEPELRVGLVAGDRRRQHAVVQRERRLDQPGDAGRRDRVADHRLDRADRAARQLAVALAEHARQRVHLGRVADRRPGPVRLDQPDAVGRDAGGRIGALERELLALDARRHHAHAAAVAGDADAADDRVHAVAVAHRVLGALQHHGADPLAQQRAVGVLVEGAQLLAARERAEPAEQVQRRHRHPHLRAAGERQVAVAREQVAHGVLHRHERGGARGVDGVGGTHQVEPVGDPPDDDVRDQPRDRLRSERRQHPLQLLAQCLELVVACAAGTAGGSDRASGRSTRPRCSAIALPPLR